MHVAPTTEADAVESPIKIKSLKAVDFCVQGQIFPGPHIKEDIFFLYSLDLWGGTDWIIFV